MYATSAPRLSLHAVDSATGRTRWTNRCPGTYDENDDTLEPSYLTPAFNADVRVALPL